MLPRHSNHPVSILCVALLTFGGTGLASAAGYDEGQWVTTFMAGGNFKFRPSQARKPDPQHCGSGFSLTFR